MQEMLTIGNKSKDTWIDLDFTKFAVGQTTGFTDTASGVVFNRTAGTCSIVQEDGLNAISFNGDGTLSGGTILDRLLDNDFKISFSLKIKTNTSNHMLFASRSTQSNGAGIWTCDMFPDGRPDFWFGNNSTRITASTAIPKGVWLNLVFESIANKMYISSNGTTLVNGASVSNISQGQGFPLIIGGSQDASAYHSRCFMRSFKIETKKR